MIGMSSLLSGTYPMDDAERTNVQIQEMRPSLSGEQRTESRLPLSVAGETIISTSKKATRHSTSNHSKDCSKHLLRSKIINPSPISLFTNSSKRNSTLYKQNSGCDVQMPAVAMSSDGSNINSSSPDSSLSFGSSTAGDSFILPVDFHEGIIEDDYGVAMFQNNPMNRSLEDPFLSPLKPCRKSFCENSRNVVANPTFQESFENRISHRSTIVENDSSCRIEAVPLSPPTSPSGDTVVTKSSKSLGIFNFPIESTVCTEVLRDSSNVVHIEQSKHNPNSYQPLKVDVACQEASCEEDEEMFEVGPIAELEISRDEDGNISPGAVSCMTDNGSKLAFKPSRRVSSKERALKMMEFYKKALGSHFDSFVAGDSSEDFKSETKSHSTSNEIKKIEKVSVAGLFLDLGLSQLLAGQFERAIESFLKASSMFRECKKLVANARALDRAGVAYCRAVKNRGGNAGGLNSSQLSQIEPYLPCGLKASRALQFLREALTIRQEELGPWHVDTVDTLNHMANLYLITGFPIQAARIGEQVFHLRQAIFGPIHPASGVVAHEVGNAYLLGDDDNKIEKSKTWYQLASEIYQELHLPLNNPAVRNLLHDIRRMEAVERWSKESLVR